jgi:hypothetical protein
MKFFIKEVSMQAIHVKKELLWSGIFALGFATVVAINTPSINQTFATPEVIYDFYSSTDAGLTTNVAVTTNWVLNDANSPGHSMTISIGKNTAVPPNDVRIGHTNSTTLTGINPGEFSYGSPSLLSLATKTNLTSNKRLYGIRMNADMDLTNFASMVVTWAWETGGDNSLYSGFLAYSTGGASESWSTLGSLKQSMALASAGQLTYTDTSTLTGLSQVRFALIFGSEVSKSAMKNVSLSVSGSLRAMLNAVDDAGFLHIGRYQVDEPFIFSDFTFHAHYLYRPSGDMDVKTGLDEGVSLSLSNTFSPLISSGHTFSEAGTYDLYYRFVDPLGYGTQSNVVSMIINDIPLILTGIAAIDESNIPIYVYDLYISNISVFPLYNNATTPNPDESPLSQSLYTRSVPYGALLIDQTINTLTYDDGFDVYEDDVPITILPRTFQQLNLSGGTLFVRGELFSVLGLTVIGEWDLGSDTYPVYENSIIDGTFTTDLVPGTILTTLGTFDVDVTYTIHNNPVIETYTITVVYENLSMFDNILNGTEDWSANIVPVFGNITNEIDNLTNAIEPFQSMDWSLTTLADDPFGDNGRFGLVNSVLRFGYNAPMNGPKEVTIESQEIIQPVINDQAVNGIKTIRMDVYTQTVSTITVNVGGVKPVSYTLNDSEVPVLGSTVTTMALEAGRLQFHFEYPVFGRVQMQYTNTLEQPGYLEFHYFAIYGAPLSNTELASSFSSMLNDSESCIEDTYVGMTMGYDYLDSLSLVPSLSSYTLSQHGSITASDLWTILESRYAPLPMNGFQPISSWNSMTWTKWTSVLGLLVLLGFIWTQKKVFSV